MIKIDIGIYQNHILANRINNSYKVQKTGYNVRDSTFPMHLLYSKAFDQLKRFDNTRNRLKLKPVIVSEYKNQNQKHKNNGLSMATMEVLETGEVIDQFYEK